MEEHHGPDASRLHRSDRSASRREFLGSVAAGGAVLTGTAAARSPSDQVRLSTRTGVVAPGQTVTAEIGLEDSPAGVCPSDPQPYEITATVDTPSAARIIALDPPAGLDSEPTIDDGETATLTVIVGHWYTDGPDENSPLGTVTLEGATAGQDVRLTVGISFPYTGCPASDASTSITVADTAPEAPTDLTLSQGTGSTIDVNWDHTADRCGSSIDHYDVSVDGTDVETVPAGVRSTTVAPGSQSGTATVGVRAVGISTGASEPVTQEFSYLHADPGSVIEPVSEANSVSVGETTAVSIHTNHPGGISELESITVGLSTPCAAEMTDASVGENASGSTSIADDRQSGTIEYEAISEDRDPSEPVATVEVTGRRVGHTRVVIESVATADNSNVSPDDSTLAITDGVELPDDTTPRVAPTIAGTSPTDPDGDGVFEDIDANGIVGFPDVNRFFQHTDNQAVQNNAALFDFTDDGEITLQDVMALFEMV